MSNARNSQRFSHKALSKKRNEPNPKRKLPILEIIGLIIAAIGLIAIWDPILKIADSAYPGAALKIEKFDLTPGHEYNKLIPLEDNFNPKIVPEDYPGGSSTFDWENVRRKCLNGTNNCLQFIDSGKIFGNKKVQLSLLNENIQQSPIILNGLKLTLIGYRQLLKSQLNLFIYTPGGGGGGPWEFYIPPYINHNVTTLFYNPENGIGSSIVATTQCKMSDTGCEQDSLIESGKSQLINLNLDFIDNLNPGWYEYEISILFNRSEMEYESKKKIILDIFKPNILQVWDTEITSHYDFDIVNKKLLGLQLSTDLNNPPGTLIIHKPHGWFLGDCIIDLQTGNLDLSGPIIPANNLFYGHWMYNRSPDGWKNALLFNYQNYEDWKVDIGIYDIKNQSLINITTQSKNYRNSYISWSPSGNKIAYIRALLEDNNTISADIFVYSIDSNSTTQITFSPLIIERNLAWIDEEKIAFIMPEKPFADGYGYGETIFNSQIGLGIVDINTNKIRILDQSKHMQLRFLPTLEALESDGKIIGLDGSIVGSMPPEQGFINENNDIFFIDPIKGDKKLIFNYSNQSNISQDNFIIGNSKPEGYIIVDKYKMRLNQFSEKGVFIRNWDLTPFMYLFNKVFKNEILLIQ